MTASERIREARSARNIAYKLTTGTHSEGGYWARVDTATHYATGRGKTRQAATRNAMSEAAGII